MEFKREEDMRSKKKKKEMCIDEPHVCWPLHFIYFRKRACVCVCVDFLLVMNASAGDVLFRIYVDECECFQFYTFKNSISVKWKWLYNLFIKNNNNYYYSQTDE